VIALALVLVALGAGDHDRSLLFGGTTRTYLVHVPPRVGEGRPLPLVLAFHGGGGNASGFKAYAGLDTVADREGFLVVYPDGSGRLGRRLLTWNAGGCCGYAAAQNVDDVGFALAVLRDVARNVLVDPARVYATGHSNGGAFTYLLWAKRGDTFAAFAPVAAAAGPYFADAKPRPLLHAASEKDPLVTFAMQQRTLDRVKKLNGCGDKGEDWAKGCLRYPSKNGTPVVIYVHDEGHKYPEAAPALIVKFFQEHARK